MQRETDAVDRAGHPHVGDQQVGVYVGAEYVQRLIPASRFKDLISLIS